jgi:hypothetical protein
MSKTFSIVSSQNSPHSTSDVSRIDLIFCGQVKLQIFAKKSHEKLGNWVSISLNWGYLHL